MALVTVSLGHYSRLEIERLLEPVQLEADERFLK